jgi:uncharacterized protein
MIQLAGWTGQVGQGRQILSPRFGIQFAWMQAVRGIVAWRFPLFLGALLLGALLLPFSRQLEFDRSIENMFSPGDSKRVAYQQFKRTFGGDEILLLVHEVPDLWSEDGSGIERVAQLTRQIRQVDGIRDVLSLSVLDRFLKPLRTSILDRDHSLASSFRDMFVGYTHGEDGQVAAVVCVLEPMTLADSEMQRTIEQLRVIARQPPAGMSPGYLVGEAALVSDSFRYVEMDASRLGWTSSLLLGLTIIVTLRSLRWVVIAVLVVQWTTFTTKGILALSGLRMSMVSSMLTAVVTVIAVATVLHIAVHFRDGCARGLPPRLALRNAMSLLGVPIFWACVTDAIGFLSLLVADVGPVRDFGWMMAIGALLVFPAVFLLVPFLALVGRRDIRGVASLGERRLETALSSLASAVTRHPRSLTAGLAALLCLALWGASRLEIETDFTRNFRQGSSIAEAYEFVEERLGGAGVWDIMIPAPMRLTEDYLTQVRDLQRQLRKIPAGRGGSDPALTKVLSMVDALDAASSQRSLAMLPPELRARGLQAVMPDFVTALRGTDPETKQPYLRIMLRAFDRRDASDKQELIAEVSRLARHGFSEEETQVTGYFVLLTHLVISVLRDQWVCFFVTLLGVGVMMSVALRSPTLALAALTANALPILLLLGTIGWLGIKLNMGAAMIAAVSMGLSVDSSIHYLFAFRRARDRGASTIEALQQAQQTVGRALVFATLALVVGFLALCTSQFVPTIYFGVLGSLSLAGGLLGNLVVLPHLLALRRV